MIYDKIGNTTRPWNNLLWTVEVWQLGIPYNIISHHTSVGDSSPRNSLPHDSLPRDSFPRNSLPYDSLPHDSLTRDNLPCVIHKTKLD